MLATSVIQINDNSYYINGDAPQGLLVLKLDNIGNEIFTKQIVKSGNKIGSSIKALIYLNGYFYQCGSIFDTLTWTPDIFLTKYNENGDTVWTKTFGGNKQDLSYYINTTIDSGFIITGVSDSYGSNGDMILIKSDIEGNFIWQKLYGDSNDEIGLSSQQTFDGGFIMSGAKYYANGNSKHYIVKTDSIGNLEWQKIYGPDKENGGCYIIQTSDNNFVTVGSIIIDGLAIQGNIRKLNQNGDTLWEKNYGANKNDWFDTQPIELEDGSLIVAGSTYNSNNKRIGWLVKFNANGDTLWSKTYFSLPQVSNYFYDLKQTIDGGFVMVGRGFDINYTASAWVVKVDSSGCEVENCVVGIPEPIFEEKLNVDIKIFPNPANETVNFETNYNGNYNNTKL
ncbi:MAG: hypothetical protein A2046_15205, partial [Bacteroidetes bacterium GWA2_30_7]